jgi:hypothetical protein
MKMKYIILLTGALLLSFSSCLESLLPVRGNGISATETRRSGPFNKIVNTTSIDIIYKNADTTSITIVADENLIEYIVTETNDNTLEIKTSPRNSYLDFKTPAFITITSPDLENINNTGSATFFADIISGDDVIISLTGSGDISAGTVRCTTLTVLLTGSGNININDCEGAGSDIILSGSGNITLKGESEDCMYKITGSGEIYAESYPVGSASVIISGSGNAFTNITDNLTAVISGSGNIYLKGDPAISQTISGSGRIIKYK